MLSERVGNPEQALEFAAWLTQRAAVGLPHARAHSLSDVSTLQSKLALCAQHHAVLLGNARVHPLEQA